MKGAKQMKEYKLIKVNDDLDVSMLKCANPSVGMMFLSDCVECNKNKGMSSLNKHVKCSFEYDSQDPSEIKTGKVTSSEEVRDCQKCVNGSSFMRNEPCLSCDPKTKQNFRLAETSEIKTGKVTSSDCVCKQDHTENKERKTWEEYDTINYGSNIHGIGIYVESHNKEKSWLDLEVATDQEYVKYCKWLKENNYLRELMLVQNTWDYNAPDKICCKKPKVEKVKKYKYVCKCCKEAPCKLVTTDECPPMDCPYCFKYTEWKLKGEA